jgi:S-adenosylmethionine:tRNA ribosyltransferase-isomerase
MPRKDANPSGVSDRLADYHFDLPAELIATRPLPARDGARMLVLDRATGAVGHRMFRDFPSYLRDGDLVVLNNSRVIRARLYSDDARIEMLLVEPLGGTRWLALVKPGRRLRLGAVCAVAGTTATVVGVRDDGSRELEFAAAPDLERYGAMPIPPYFHRRADAEDTVRYQTVFAETPGSVAAPTAGLHFTPEVLGQIPHTFITLHVGIGTFQPVKTERITDHTMHEEHYEISAASANAINRAQRIVAVGTTTTRVLESQPPGPIVPHSGSTAIFLHPPKTLHRVDALLTNFHLPESTLLMLISAMAGRERILAAYAEAVRERYRFFSYGDCMLIV